MKEEESKTANAAPAAESVAKRARISDDLSSHLDHLTSTVDLAHSTLTRACGESRLKYTTVTRLDGESLLDALADAKGDVKALIAHEPGAALTFSDLGMKMQRLNRAHQQAQQLLQLTGDLIAALGLLDVAPIADPAAVPAAKPAP